MSDHDNDTGIIAKLRAPWQSMLDESPKAVRTFWVVSLVLLLLIAFADIFVHHHEHFGIDGTPGFYSLYGLGACVVMVLGSKFVVALVLKRKDTYYDD
ncbi:MAG: hypothetical protein KC486_15175 [Myxococcales bacterium]|nr:hypothetical protein [Myxococcales bacterium]